MSEFEVPEFEPQMLADEPPLLFRLPVELKSDLLEARAKGITNTTIELAMCEFIKQSIASGELGKVIALYISGDPLKVGGFVPDPEDYRRPTVTPGEPVPAGEVAVNKASSGGFSAPSKRFGTKKEGK